MATALIIGVVRLLGFFAVNLCARTLSEFEEGRLLEDAMIKLLS